MVKAYGVVIAHKEGAAIERIVAGTESVDMAEAQQHADAWTRRHGHGPLDCDQFGFYAYADRITRPAYRVWTKRR